MDLHEYLFHSFVAHQVISPPSCLVILFVIVFMLGGGWLEYYCLETAIVDMGCHGMSLFLLFV